MRFGSLFSTLQTTENVSCCGACRWKLLPPTRYFISREKIPHVHYMLPRAVERSRLSQTFSHVSLFLVQSSVPDRYKVVTVFVSFTDAVIYKRLSGASK